MGTVYLARDLALGRHAALKMVANSLDPELRERLLMEAEAAAVECALANIGVVFTAVRKRLT